MFIRQQFSPYCSEGVNGVFQSNLEYLGPCPHGRNGWTGTPDDWGPDEFGYTDFDDYHLAVFGA